MAMAGKETDRQREAGRRNWAGKAAHGGAIDQQVLSTTAARKLVIPTFPRQQEQTP
jgi:hypothetical protein